MGLRAIRHSPLAYGMLLRRPRDGALTRGWVEPARTDRAIRGDIARFARHLDRQALVEAAPRVGSFTGPVRVVWGTADRNFTLASGARLADAFEHGELVEVPGVSTFVPVDEPAAVADAVVAVATARQDVAG
jgi:pimeloyl-ACP methyl ester carboxylesterase